jgi:hypothetical protein
MTKQIKLGFDKIPVPSTTSYEQLYDLTTGVVLKDSEGNPLYTKEESTIKSFGRADKSTSMVVNNSPEYSLKIQEVFQETSQVSSSLLGIPRSETQLSLFSDVSTYGLDNNNWEYFRYNTTAGSEPAEWSLRKNQIYGERFFSKLDEVSNEQALALTAFPVPWSFPYGPRFRDIGYYNETSFDRYLKFIELGNLFYDFYSSRGFNKFAEDNFLNPNYVNKSNVSLQGDVFYNIEEYRSDVVFEKIETWTMTWMKVRDGELFDPTNNKVIFPTGYDSTNNTPGYSSQRTFYSQLESRKVFRYQPGRISGFTFGVRASTDPGSLSNIIEWGCCNESDEYVFQIRGSQFNIVRRSAIPLPKENIERMGMSESDQVLKPVINPLRSAGVRNTGDPSTSPSNDELYELVIGRDFFNGDALNGNGPSGYIIGFEEVTMYKIEFSWYGAIGAKFYAYIPSGNSEARWVLIHTIVIENQLGQPCLKDPFFKFRYMLAINDTSNLRTPQYIYKYGASYYIDGGDEGTTTIHNYSSNNIQTEISNSRSVMGVKAKDTISNSRGEANKNRKDITIQKMFVTSSTPARIDVIECEGCPGGFGYFYAPSLRKGIAGIVGSLTMSSDGTRAEFEPTDTDITDYLPPQGVLTKIINQGIYSSYLDDRGDILRRVGNTPINNQALITENYSTVGEVRLPNNEIVDPKGFTFDNSRLSNYSLVVSSVKLTKKNILVNFLNPRALDNGQFAEFFIGVTNKEPSVDLISEKLLLDNQTPVFEDIFYTEYAQYAARKNREGYDIGEGDDRYGDVFEIDPLISNPPGVDSGRCSRAKITVNSIVLNTEYSDVHPTNGNSGDYLIFTSAFISSIGDLQGGEIGIPNINPGEYKSSDIFFTENSPRTFMQAGQIKYFVEISGSLDNNISEIAIKFLIMTGRFVSRTKAFNWNVFPLYVVVGMRDNARVNNITFDEEDEIGKFTHTPIWLTDLESPIEVIERSLTEGTNPTTGLFESGGSVEQGIPPANFKENYRLDSAQVDTQLQQPLRPGEVRSSVFIGGNETLEFDLGHVFGADRYVITPGLTNTKATFITAKSLEGGGDLQISIINKEQ